MGSWKPSGLAGHKYSVDDLVELREHAERGLAILYRVRGKCADGGLNLHRVDINDGLTVTADDVAEGVIPARPESIAAQRHSTERGSGTHGVDQGRGGGAKTYTGLRG